jgi:hypothetical protein
LILDQFFAGGLLSALLARLLKSSLGSNQKAIKIHAFPIAGGAEHRAFFLLPYAHSFLPLGTFAAKSRLYLELLKRLNLAGRIIFPMIYSSRSELRLSE